MRDAKLGKGMHADCLSDLKDMVSYRGIWGASPRKFLDSRAANGEFQCFLLSF